MTPSSILLAGSRQPLPAPLRLRAGPLTVRFDPATGFLRHLRIGDHEVLRAIYGAVRDRHWRTIEPALQGLHVDRHEDAFRITFTAECRRDEITFLWRGDITGDSAGTVQYTFEGVARSRFLRNRIGLCALHPMSECAGQACRIEHADGSIEAGRFPHLVSPHQPFRQIRAITHEAIPGVRCEVRFDGEVFEMEDQRNWTDASFKTYGTPLDLPMPVLVEPGDTVRQVVTLSLTGWTGQGLQPLEDHGVQLSVVTAARHPLPALGLCAASHGQPLTARELDCLRVLHPAHLRVDLRLASTEWPQALAHGAEEARHLETGLAVALLLNDDAETQLQSFAAECARLRPPVRLWLVFHEGEASTRERWVHLAQPVLRELAPDAPVAAGSRRSFAEINREPLPAQLPVLPCYPVSPQAHAFDNTSLVENLAGAPLTVETARGFSPQPVVISPVTLRPPPKPGASGAPGASALPAQVDLRQLSLFAAGWLLGLVGRLTATGHVHSLTCFETTGWLGVLESDEGSLLPDAFPSLPGMVFPLYHVLADLAEFPGALVNATRSSHPLRAEGIALTRADGRRRFVVANLGGAPLDLCIQSGPCQGVVRYLDETTVEEALVAPETYRARACEPIQSTAAQLCLRLRPYAVATVDV